MSDPVVQFLEASDNADAYAQAQTDALKQRALEDIDELYRTDAARDADLWNELGVDPELTIEHYEEEDSDERNMGWILGLAGMAAASSTQFFLDNRQETIVKPAAYREQALAGIVLTREQLVRAGKREVQIIQRERFEALQAKYLAEFAELSEAANVELYRLLDEYGAIKPVDRLITEQSGRVSRMVAFRPGSTQFREATANLIDFGAGRQLVTMNRRAVERIYSYRSAGEDLSTLMCWIGEHDSRTCEYCERNFGKIKTYKAWIAEGLPGEICAGQEDCRCHLEAA